MKDWQDLSEQLRKLGVKLGMPNEPHKHAKTHYPIEKVLNCSETHTPAGTILSVRQTFDYYYAQGNTKLAPYTHFHRLLKWAKIPDHDLVSLKNLVFLDTETTGLSSGTGTMAFMVGVGKFIDNHFLLEQFFLRNPAEEAAFLHALSLFCADMKAVVTYNGKAFDIPILNTRHILQRIPSPFLDVYHIDLLTISRQLWRLRLTQCNLANIERNILEFQRKGGEVPGYLAPEFYKDYLRTGDARPLEGVFYHNQEDVVSLSALFNKVASLLENPKSDDLKHSNDMFSAARVFNHLQDFETADLLYSQSLQSETSQELFIKYLLEHAQFLRRNKAYDDALKLWIRAAELDNLEALIQLAKHHEHKSKDFQQALSITLKAISIMQDDSSFTDAQLFALFHRKKRLESKINKSKEIK